jgi:hypothetical protein
MELEKTRIGKLERRKGEKEKEKMRKRNMELEKTRIEKLERRKGEKENNGIRESKDRKTRETERKKRERE